ncbi:MAG TPA: type II secretion system protein GspN [Deltaproteobacteria bacterium]|nr:MAG: type II secretion system protein GspN [Deltaproteobacteria bacterium GWA2_45_12]HBF13920.1 type II secretion system protein GspN [Deltaproteobacteria bacterium]
MLHIMVGVFAFFFFLVLFFPFETLVRYFLSQVEIQSKGAYKINVGEIDPSFFFKTSLKDFELVLSKPTGDVVLLKTPELKIGVSYLPLLASHVDASFELKSKKGGMEGNMFLSQTMQRFDVDLNQMDFAEFPLLAGWLKIPLSGEINGNIMAEIYPEQVGKNEGEINLKLKDLKIAAGKMDLYQGFELEIPDTVLSANDPAVLKATLSKGRLDVKELNIPGPDMALKAAGRVQINRKLSFAHLSVNGSFQFSQKLQEVLSILVLIEKQKNEQGWYPFNLSGQVSRPKLQVGTIQVL